ncbi:MAG: helix-turn-helix transcriptional regulator [Nitrococcus sp.]|nr:helix-turn-helix transcriptional regulator [Nitrococcus sp.]
MKPAASAEARIKQLCCLGLGGEATIPALLAELHALIPSYANCFSWSDAQGRMSKMFVENIDEFLLVASAYHEVLHNRREEEVIISFGEAMRGGKIVLTFDEMLKVDRRTYYRHDYYNLVCRALNFHWSINVVASEHGVPMGGLSLHRAKDDPEFKAEDTHLLTRLMPFLTHALAAVPASEIPLVDSGDEGFVIADLKGTICHLSAEARRLLILATQPTIGPRIPSAGLGLPAPVTELCRRLAAVFNGREASAPPTYHHRNCLGGFTFRAYVLNRDGLAETAPEPAPLVGIHIRHQEPQTLRIVRRLGEMPGLSQRQMQIGLLLATGAHNAAIASQMNVSSHTVVTHTRRLYEKLAVHNRSELVAKLTGV